MGMNGTGKKEGDQSEDRGNGRRQEDREKKKKTSLN